MNDTPEQNLDAALEASMGNSTVRYLKTLVTAMTLTTILGLVVLVGVVVLRFSQSAPAALPAVGLPDEISLPAGMAAQAFTRGPDWYAVVTETDEILVFDLPTGALLKTVKIRED